MLAKAFGFGFNNHNLILSIVLSFKLIHYGWPKLKLGTYKCGHEFINLNCQIFCEICLKSNFFFVSETSRSRVKSFTPAPAPQHWYELYFVLLDYALFKILVSVWWALSQSPALFLNDFSRMVDLEIAVECLEPFGF